MDNPLVMHGEFNKDILLTPMRRYISLEESSVVEVGCGNGRIAMALAPHVNRYVGIDICGELLDMASTAFFDVANASFMEGDGEKELPIRDEAADAVIYVMSLHFMKDHQKAFSESRRVLKPNGILTLFEPTEGTTSWQDPKLRPDSPTFNPTSYDRKMNDIRRMTSFLETQTLFDVLEKSTEYRGNRLLMVLGNK